MQEKQVTASEQLLERLDKQNEMMAALITASLDNTKAVQKADKNNTEALTTEDTDDPRIKTENGIFIK